MHCLFAGSIIELGMLSSIILKWHIHCVQDVFICRICMQIVYTYNLCLRIFLYTIIYVPLEYQFWDNQLRRLNGHLLSVDGTNAHSSKSPLTLFICRPIEINIFRSWTNFVVILHSFAFSVQFCRKNMNPRGVLIQSNNDNHIHE